MQQQKMDIEVINRASFWLIYLQANEFERNLNWNGIFSLARMSKMEPYSLDYVAFLVNHPLFLF